MHYWRWALISFFLSACAGLPKFSETKQLLLGAASGQTPSDAKLISLCQEGRAVACALLGRPAGQSHPLSILQGFTNANTARFTVVLPRDLGFQFIISQLPEPGTRPQVLTSIEPSSTQTRDFSPWKAIELEANGLKLGQDYELWVVGADGEIWDRRIFAGLDLEKSRPRIVVASCQSDSFQKLQSIAWEKVRSLNPDLIFLIGDNSYADQFLGHKGPANPKELWQRYVTTRNSLLIYRWPRLVPVLATWDDHDYGSDDGNRDYKFKTETQAIFFSFFAQKSAAPEWERGPGVSGRLNAFGQVFVLFDNRSFRSPDNETATNQTHFGEEQEKWAFYDLNRKQNPVWFISGGQFFGAYHAFESYERNQPQSFQRFRERLKELSVPFWFVSGDRHFIELMKISRAEVGINTYELTTSPIHAVVFSDALTRDPNPRRMLGAAGKQNFVEIETSLDRARLELDIHAWGVNEGLLFSRRLTVSSSH